LVGSCFVSALQAEALGRGAVAAIVAVASPMPGHAERFATDHSIPYHYTDARALYDRRDIDLVVLGLSNDGHCDAAVRATEAGKHVVVEKPMALFLAECDRMIAACERASVMLGYAEELCFAPKYVRLKALVDEGALGRAHLVKQSEKHYGPHTAWFYDTHRSGGGVTMDMGCHAIEVFRWLLGRPNQTSRVAGAYARMGKYVHTDRTDGDDASVLIVDFEGGAIGVAEESWTKPGGIDDRAEVFGSAGPAYADLLRGNALLAYSVRGHGYAVEKAGATQGWSFPVFEELRNYGFVQEMEHFVGCVREGMPPCEDGHDGRAVLEVIFALYAAVAQERRISLPLATDAARPIDFWRRG
jgi:predicted dehydrogenase